MNELSKLQKNQLYSAYKYKSAKFKNVRHKQFPHYNGAKLVELIDLDGNSVDLSTVSPELEMNLIIRFLYPKKDAKDNRERQKNRSNLKE